MPYGKPAKAKERLSPLQIGRTVLAVALGLAALVYLLPSLRWPLVGEAAQLHYSVFLTAHGMTPYEATTETHMPGTLLAELAAMYMFGFGEVAWRLFDLALLTVAGGSLFVLTKRAGWFAGVLAACLFALVHGREGLEGGGATGLMVAAFLLAGTACLFVAVRTRVWWAAGGFGLMSGVAMTMDPGTVLLSAVLLGLGAWTLARRGRRWKLRVKMAVGMMLFWPVVVLVFLLAEGALGAFFAGLGREGGQWAWVGLGRMLLPLLPLVMLWVGVLATARPRWSGRGDGGRTDWERMALAAGVVYAGIGCLVHVGDRYVLVGFLLALMALDLTQATNALGAKALPATAGDQPRARAGGMLAAAALVVAALLVGPWTAWRVHRIRWWETDYNNALEQKLVKLGDWKLYGKVQCMDQSWDPTAGCVGTLYRMRLMPVSGTMEDWRLRGTTLREYPAQVMVVSSRMDPDGRLARWPELKQTLEEDYRLDQEWTPARSARWGVGEEMPAAFRVYVRRGWQPAPPPGETPAR